MEEWKHIVEEGAHGGCRNTLWMGIWFRTSTWKLFTGLYSTEGGTKHESGKGYTLSSGPGHCLPGKFALSHREETTTKILFVTRLKLLKS